MVVLTGRVLMSLRGMMAVATVVVAARFVLGKHGGGADQWPLCSLQWFLEAVATNRKLSGTAASASGSAACHWP